ncbi:MAG: HAD-IIIA family hydrolase [Lachnospiraceae bacterium]|nr:HAD-IIIA family hydrolase [Lachnospiraceae bacterium]
MKYKAVICDLDGTLLNTLEDLMDSVNYALTNKGMDNISLEQTRRYVGNGVAKLVERAAGGNVTNEDMESLLIDFRYYYGMHSKDKTKPYDGVVELLSSLKEKGMKLAIVSNKIHNAVEVLADEYFSGLIDVAIGEMGNVPRKPAPDMIYKAIEELGVEKDEAVFIGDSEVDVATGLNAGIDMVTVLWGFRDKAQLIEAGATVFIDNPEGLISYL